LVEDFEREIREDKIRQVKKRKEKEKVREKEIELNPEAE